MEYCLGFFFFFLQNQALDPVKHYPRRLEHANEMLRQYALDPNFLNTLFFLDETTFDICWTPGTHTVVRNKFYLNFPSNWKVIFMLRDSSIAQPGMLCRAI